MSYDHELKRTADALESIAKSLEKMANPPMVVPDDDKKKYLTVFEVSKLLKMDQKRIQRLGRLKKLAGAVTIPSGEIRFDSSILSTWLDGQAKSTEGEQ